MQLVDQRGAGQGLRTRSADPPHANARYFDLLHVVSSQLPLTACGKNHEAPARANGIHKKKAGPWGRPSVGGFAAAYAIDARTRSGVNGTRRMRTPVASNTALAMAPATGRIEGSPAPVGSRSGRLIST